MEIDIGNLLYIAFVALILIANAFKKKKKTERRRSRDSERVGPVLADPRKSFEELLQEFTNPPQPAPPPPPAKPKPKPIPQSATIEESARPAEPVPLKKKEHNAMKTEYGKFNEFEKSESKTSPYAEAFRNLGNARLAFVYSEIFRRKF